MKNLLSFTAIVAVAGLPALAQARDMTVAALNVAPFLDPDAAVRTQEFSTVRTVP